MLKEEEMIPKSAKISLLAGLALLTLPGDASSQSQPEGERISAVTLGKMDLAAIAALPGVSSAFVIGDFDAEGLYTAQAEMEQDSTFPPHAHPDVRVTVVISGTMYLGEGETFDESALVAYPEGSVAITSADTFHFMAAPDGDVRVLEIGVGPSGTVFPGGN